MIVGNWGDLVIEIQYFSIINLKWSWRYEKLNTWLFMHAKLARALCLEKPANNQNWEALIPIDTCPVHPYPLACPLVSLAPVRLIFCRKSEQINWVSGSTWPKQTTDRLLDHGRYRMLVYVAQAVSQKIITRYTSTLRFSLGFCYHACCSQYQRGNVLGWMPYSKGWQVASDKGQHFYLQTTKTTKALVP